MAVRRIDRNCAVLARRTSVPEIVPVQLSRGRRRDFVCEFGEGSARVDGRMAGFLFQIQPRGRAPEGQAERPGEDTVEASSQVQKFRVVFGQRLAAAFLPEE